VKRMMVRVLRSHGQFGLRLSREKSDPNKVGVH
jgi:hypothetical protein